MFLIELSYCHFSSRLGEFDKSCTQGVFLLNLGGFSIRFEILNNLLKFRFQARLQELHMVDVAAIHVALIVVVPSVKNVTFGGRMPLLITNRRTRHDEGSVRKERGGKSTLWTCEREEGMKLVLYLMMEGDT